MRAELAVDRMTVEQLTKAWWKHYYEIEPYNFERLELRVKQLRWRQLARIQAELMLRGVQLSLGLLAEEKVARNNHGDVGSACASNALTGGNGDVEIVDRGAEDG